MGRENRDPETGMADPRVKRNPLRAKERRAERGGFRDAETIRANKARKRRRG